MKSGGIVAFRVSGAGSDRTITASLENQLLVEELLGRPEGDDPGFVFEAVDTVLTDRFFGPQLRGFDIRGIGPRIQSIPYTCADAACTNPELDLTQARITDALGGRAYYMGRLELEVPVSASIKNMGLRPSAFVDVGSLFKLTPPELLNIPTIGTPKTGVGPSCVQNLGDSDTSNDAPCDPALFNILPGRREFYVGDSPKPRLSIGVGVNWISPFGPLRIDIAKALLKQDGDDTKLFSFNVGTAF